MHVLPMFIRGRWCPRCGAQTGRVPTPFLLRPVRWALPAAVRRQCHNAACGWRGFALPAVDPQVARHRHHHVPDEHQAAQS